MTPERPAPQRDPQPGIVIARPFGIPVYISPYWFVIAGLFILLYANSLEHSVSGNLRYVVSTAFVVLLYASVLVHELSHCVVARAFGLPVRRILLYPLGGFSEIEKEAPTPAREFLVSAAGPILSLWKSRHSVATGCSPTTTPLRMRRKRMRCVSKSQVLWHDSNINDSMCPWCKVKLASHWESARNSFALLCQFLVCPGFRYRDVSARPTK